ncbi:unnamed protein product [Rotaria sordida]|uniref:Uncharacterized protein n=1 Tax=Rotaria sordida TaxID=392033 RepID=A0A815XLV0_9BILA|nr:unnamed protein product [Rotaria sordida]CAF1559587.1 unnamed protein product [Rotaria sordida]
MHTVQLRMIKGNESREQLWQSHVELRREVGECADENILFGCLLADMNRVPAAIDYYVSINYIEGDMVFPTSLLTSIGRGVLRRGTPVAWPNGIVPY